tara:strand:- start:16530 stop:17387 length:858 start_codon:yes stop_codon:yes gene_type:complete
VWIKDFFDLIKIRILFSALLTTFFGYSVGLDFSFWNMSDLFWLLLGSGFIFSASAALNHVLEKDVDGLMERTQFRPLPTARITHVHVICMVIAFMLIGIVILYIKTNWLVLLNGLFVFVLYDFVYTPLKRFSSMNTFVGAFPGAMPLLSGWFMVQESFSYFILLLFLMLYLWQLPHFFSIAWIYRRSYESANLKMVSIHDESGRRTRFYLFFSSILFVVATYLPLFYGDLGVIYIYVVTLLNICLIGYVCKFCLDLNDMIARKILFITIFYPPLIPLVYVIGLFL